jgi:hypothetical protein
MLKRQLPLDNRESKESSIDIDTSKKPKKENNKSSQCERVLEVDIKEINGLIESADEINKVYPDLTIEVLPHSIRRNYFKDIFMLDSDWINFINELHKLQGRTLLLSIETRFKLTKMINDKNAFKGILSTRELISLAIIVYLESKNNKFTKEQIIATFISDYLTRGEIHNLLGNTFYKNIEKKVGFIINYIEHNELFKSIILKKPIHCTIKSPTLTKKKFFHSTSNKKNLKIKTKSDSLINENYNNIDKIFTDISKNNNQIELKIDQLQIIKDNLRILNKNIINEDLIINIDQNSTRISQEYPSVYISEIEWRVILLKSQEIFGDLKETEGNKITISEIKLNQNIIYETFTTREIVSIVKSLYLNLENNNLHDKFFINLVRKIFDGNYNITEEQIYKSSLTLRNKIYSALNTLREKNHNNTFFRLLKSIEQIYKNQHRKSPLLFKNYEQVIESDNKSVKHLYNYQLSKFLSNVTFKMNRKIIVLDIKELNFLKKKLE